MGAKAITGKGKIEAPYVVPAGVSRAGNEDMTVSVE